MKDAVKWDLRDLYKGMKDPRIEMTLKSGIQRSEEFASKYKSKIDSPELSAHMLRQALEEYESILQEIDKPAGFASLLFSADTNDAARGAFLQSMRERHTEIAVRLVFFELELMAIPEERMAELAKNPILAPYQHHIWAARLFREHRLSEAEEKLLEEKANTGKRAFARLFEQIVSNILFQTSKGDEVESLTLSEILALLRNPEREIRKTAAAGLTEGLVSNSRALTYIHNILIQDKATDDRLRRYEYPEQPRHLANEVEQSTVELVISTAVDNYPLVGRYYRLKRKILGYEKLMHYDRYAPLFETKEEIEFAKAREIVMNAFGEFNTVMKSVGDKFFENGWIDAEVRKGKRGGAYCSYITPDLHPYVFLNYLNKMDDVMTLGHEMGHAVHACLAREQTYMNFAPVLPVAELASTFGEMLVFEALQKKAGLEDKLALYADKIEGAFATIFRQAAMYKFEQATHAMRREQGELTIDQFSVKWQELQQEMFGDSVELGDEHKLWWMYVPHFINSPFYVYAYTFGELLVMSLYAMYKRDGDSFSPRYIELLKAGGSSMPGEMLSRIGIDIQEPAFWQGGMEVLAGMVDQFEELHREWKKNATH